MNTNYKKTSNSLKKVMVVLPLLFFLSINAFALVDNSDGLEDFSMHIKSSNAISAEQSVVKESIEGKVFSVKVMKITIPFFENEFIGKLYFTNDVNVNSKYFTPEIVPPCKNELSVYNSFIKGKRIAMTKNAMRVELTHYVSGIGYNNLRVIAECNGVNYAINYFRIIVEKEPKPIINLKMKSSISEKSIDSPKGKLKLILDGDKVDNSRLFMKVIPPCSGPCKIENVPLTEKSSGETDLFECEAEGKYIVQLVYFSDKVGEGIYNKVLETNEWSTFVYVNGNETCTHNHQKVIAMSDVGITLSPNPTKNLVTIYLPEKHNSTLTKATVYDMSGKMLFSKAMENNNYQIEMGALPKGTYIVKVLVGDNEYTEKVVKI